jgi:RimJ/RimL family protein N-acetyltransferase
MGSLRLISAGEADIPFVMRTERLPGYDTVVGRWDEQRHRAAMADGRHAYFLAIDADAPAGFAIVRDWSSPDRVSLVKRIAMQDSGRGLGSRFLAKLVDHIFTATDTHRICLGVFPENRRAIKAYEKVGFLAEGVAHGSAYFGGIYRDEMVMAMVRTDWSLKTSASQRG